MSKSEVHFYHYKSVVDGLVVVVWPACISWVYMQNDHRHLPYLDVLCSTVINELENEQRIFLITRLLRDGHHQYWT